MATDYRTRLTADTSQHDKALKKSAQEVYKYKKQTENAKVTLGNLASKFGPLAAQIGIAGGALAIFKKTLTSTEAGSDAFNRVLYVGKKSVESFFQSLSTGNFDSFITGLKNIKKTAEEAFNALDDLGTITNYNNAAVAELQAKIEQQRTIALNPKSTTEQKRAAEQLIRQYEDEIRNLNREVITAGEKAASKLVAELAKNPYLSEQTIQEWLDMKAHGTLSKYISDYAAEHSTKIQHRGTTSGVNRFSGPVSYDWTETRWESGTKKIYDAMQAVLAASEEEGNSYSEWLRVRTANAQRIIQQERENQRINKLSEKIDKFEAKTTPKYEKGSIADIEAQIQALQDRLKNEVLNGAEVRAIQKQIEVLQVKKEALESLGKPMEKLKALEMPLEEPVIMEIDNTQFIEALQEAIDKIEEVGLTIDDLQRINGIGESLGELGDIFSNVSEIMDDESGKIFAALGQSISGIGEAIAKISSLMMAEGAASVMDLPFPANMAALGAVIAAITSVIASIQSVGSQSFAGGGIVQGATSIGDYVHTNLNAGEMVLNKGQQQHLFNLLSGSATVTAATDNKSVEFIIRGSDLYGTLSNYNRKRNRVQ